jgi:hypothetical protein
MSPRIRGRKRHLLVDTEGLVLKAKVHSAKVPDQDGLKLLLDSARTAVSHLICGEGRFGVGPQHFILATEHRTDPSEASAVVPVLCGNCGYMMLFGTKMLPDEGR